VRIARLDSEQFRFAPRTCRPPCGRLKLRKTEHGPVGGSDSASGEEVPMLDMKRRSFITLSAARRSHGRSQRARSSPISQSSVI
jgi:hypothetical protein